VGYTFHVLLKKFYEGKWLQNNILDQGNPSSWLVSWETLLTNDWLHTNWMTINIVEWVDMTWVIRCHCYTKLFYSVVSFSRTFKMEGYVRVVWLLFLAVCLVASVSALSCHPCFEEQLSTVSRLLSLLTVTLSLSLTIQSIILIYCS